MVSFISCYPDGWGEVGHVGGAGEEGKAGVQRQNKAGIGLPTLQFA